MIFYQKVEFLNQINVPSDDLYLAIGIFDGVHRGHQVLIQSAIRMAKENKGKAAVLTFYPHPSRLFTPTSFRPLILNSSEKALILSHLRVHILIEQHFTLHFARTPAESFLPELQSALPRLKSIFVGKDFHFGHQRQGSIPLLIESAHQYGIEVCVIQPIEDKRNQVISSTRIRTLLQKGQVQAANELLGYKYFFQGKSLKALIPNRPIGFPTLNFFWQNEVHLRHGVYLVRLIADVESNPLKKDWGASGMWGIANFGISSTQGGELEPILEVYLFETSSLTVEQVLRIEFWDFIRPEQKFSSLESFKAQIQQDIQEAHLLLETAL